MGEEEPDRYMEVWIRPDGVEFVRVSDLMGWLNSGDIVLGAVGAALQEALDKPRVDEVPA